MTMPAAIHAARAATGAAARLQPADDWREVSRCLSRASVGELFTLAGMALDALRSRGVVLPETVSDEIDEAKIEHDARSGALDVHLARIPAGEVA